MSESTCAYICVYVCICIGAKQNSEDSLYPIKHMVSLVSSDYRKINIDDEFNVELWISCSILSLMPQQK